ncbi:MAG: DUF2207 domain-containing protein, partial [Nanoarchaeota archaeon]|nr:DUF2207 domain-containing protein [Nanoarchaeota archaeon]
MRKKILVLIFLIAILGFASAAAFSFQSASNDYMINSDGSISVTERMSITFYEKFKEGYREIPLNGIQISEIEVYSGNNKLIHRTKNISNGIEISWNLSGASSESFRINYKLKKALKVYDDVAEFNAKVWGDQWNVGLGKLSGRIELPGKVNNPEEVYTFGHPQFEGAIRLQNNEDVVYEIYNIPANQWAEVRVVFPRRLLTSTSGALMVAGNGLEKILAEENQIGLFGIIGLVLYWVFHPVVLALVFFVILWFLYGREPKTDYLGIYERDLPYKYSPSVVAALVNQQTREPEQKDFVADLMNLCLKGVFKFKQIQGKKDDFEIMFIKEFDEKVGPEKEVYDFVKARMGKDNKVTFSEIKNFVKKNPKTGFDFINNWTKAAERGAEKLKFFTKQIGLSFYFGFIITLVFAIFLGIGELFFWIIIFGGAALFAIVKKMDLDFSIAAMGFGISIVLLLTRSFFLNFANIDYFFVVIDFILGIIAA